jgi:hypothetical protein
MENKKKYVVQILVNKVFQTVSSFVEVRHGDVFRLWEDEAMTIPIHFNGTEATCFLATDDALICEDGECIISCIDITNC